jgi:hypothetical protein
MSQARSLAYVPSGLTAMSICCHMLNSPSSVALRSHLPFALSRSNPHHTQQFFALHRQTNCIVYTACIHCLEETKIARLSAYLHARCTSHQALTTNNGHPTEGKTKGLDSATATSRVLPKRNRRRCHGGPSILLQLAGKENSKVTKQPQNGGGDCRGQDQGKG